MEETRFSAVTEHIKELGGKMEEPMGFEIARLCDFAETLVNGNPLRKEELLNIMNFVSLSIQNVLRPIDDPKQKAVKIEWLKAKVEAANRQLIDMKINNNNGHHDKVGLTVG